MVFMSFVSHTTPVMRRVADQNQISHVILVIANIKLVGSFGSLLGENKTLPAYQQQ